MKLKSGGLELKGTNEKYAAGTHLLSELLELPLDSSFFAATCSFGSSFFSVGSSSLLSESLLFCIAMEGVVSYI